MTNEMKSKNGKGRRQKKEERRDRAKKTENGRNERRGDKGDLRLILCHIGMHICSVTCQITRLLSLTPFITGYKCVDCVQQIFCHHGLECASSTTVVCDGREADTECCEFIYEKTN